MTKRVTRRLCLPPRVQYDGKVLTVNCDGKIIAIAKRHAETWISLVPGLTVVGPPNGKIKLMWE
jgi:hypothetical protein